MLRLASTLSILALFLVAAAADAKCTGPGCATSRTQTTQTVTFQSVQVVQPPVVAIQAGGCQGGVGTVTASGCAGSQGASGRQHKLFSGGLLHHGSGNGLFARHKKQGASAGYEQTTTTRQWDNRPTPAAIIVVPQQAAPEQQQP